MVDFGKGIDRHHRNRRLVIPCGVHPVAEIATFRHGQLHDAKAGDGRHVHHKPPVLPLLHGVRDEILKREDHVVVAAINLDNGLVRRQLEADNQFVSIAAEPVGAIRHSLAGMDELRLVVERPYLRGRKKRNSRARLQTLFAGCLYNERFRAGILADAQCHPLVLEHHVVRRRRQHANRRKAEGN